MSDRRPAHALMLLAVVAVAVSVRLPWLAYGITADEAANLSSQGAVAIWSDPETGVNPPLLRLALNLGVPEAARIEAGRALSFACGVAAAAMTAELGRRAGGLFAGLVAGLLLALHPTAAQSAAEVRAYAPFMAAASGHLWAVTTGRRRAAVATAILLPWLHYLGLVWLIAEGAALSWTRAREARAAWAGLACATPLLWPILTQPGRHTPPARSAAATLTHLAGFGLSPPWSLALSPAGGAAVMACVVAALVVTAARPGSPAIARLSAVITAGLLGGAALISTAQNVRDPVIGVVLVAAAPALAAVRSPVALAGAMLWFGAAELQLTGPLLQRRADTDSPAWLADQVRAAPAGEALYVHPASAVPLAWVALTGAPFDRATREGCDGTCFSYEGRRVLGLARVGDGATLRGVVVSVETPPPPGIAAACAPLPSDRWRRWRCGP